VVACGPRWFAVAVVAVERWPPMLTRASV
jgi:hypothetical protein